MTTIPSIMRRSQLHFVFFANLWCASTDEVTYQHVWLQISYPKSDVFKTLYRQSSARTCGNSHLRSQFAA